MPRRKPQAQRFARQLTELAFAAPQVVAHRTLRMAAAGNPPSARDHAEFMRMGTEKVAAFQQSWMSMWMAMWSLQVEMATTLSSMAMRLAPAMLAPYHRRVVANARRLRR
jgi:hypothetical protein